MEPTSASRAELGGADPLVRSRHYRWLCLISRKQDAGQGPADQGTRPTAAIKEFHDA